MTRACVIGWPIAHSRSPLIHGYWLQQHGIDGYYTREPVEPENLAAFFARLRAGEFAGCNVTMPHKEASLALVDDVDARVQRMGSLNTVYHDGGRLCATSTDGPGFVASVQDAVPGFNLADRPVLLLGAGGSARAIADELLRIGTETILVHNRTRARAEELAQLLGPAIVPVDAQDMAARTADCGLVVNTVPASAHAGLPADDILRPLRDHAVVADIIYTPLVTPFLVAARHRGHRTVPGLGMLLHQAVPGFEKWFGVRPVVTPALYDLVATDIDPDYRR